MLSELCVPGGTIPQRDNSGRVLGRCPPGPKHRMSADLERYSKQVLFAGIGEAGQRKLLAGRALLCGCGALGSVLAETLVRAGVGLLRIVDRDFVELSNLQRQVLFDENDIAERLPKAIAAAEKLRRINSEVRVEPIVADVDHTNIRQLAEGVDLILDGSDNFELRFLINDASLETGVPWIYAGVIGSHGQVMPIFPGAFGLPPLPDRPDARSGLNGDLRHGRHHRAGRAARRLARSGRRTQNPLRPA